MGRAGGPHDSGGGPPEPARAPGARRRALGQRDRGRGAPPRAPFPARPDPKRRRPPRPRADLPPPPEGKARHPSHPQLEGQLARRPGRKERGRPGDLPHAPRIHPGPRTPPEPGLPDPRPHPGHGVRHAGPPGEPVRSSARSGHHPADGRGPRAVRPARLRPAVPRGVRLRRGDARRGDRGAAPGLQRPRPLHRGRPDPVRPKSRSPLLHRRRRALAGPGRREGALGEDDGAGHPDGLSGGHSGSDGGPRRPGDRLDANRRHPPGGPPGHGDGRARRGNEGRGHPRGRPRGGDRASGRAGRLRRAGAGRRASAGRSRAAGAHGKNGNEPGARAALPGGHVERPGKHLRGSAPRRPGAGGGGDGR